MKLISIAKLANKLAHKSQHKHKLGAVLFKNNKILSVGFNQLKTHPKSTHPYKTIHAEMQAIFSCPVRSLNGASLYVCRVSSSGIAMAKPCEHCEQLIRSTGIKQVYYTINNLSYGVTSYDYKVKN